jgi:tight adherence protein C
VVLVLPILGFLFVSLLVAAAAMMFSSGSAATVERRLGEIAIERRTPGMPIRRYERAVVDTLKRLGKVAPKSLSEMTKLQQRLVRSGFRGKEALPTFVGIRMGVALLFFVLAATPLFYRTSIPLALGIGGLGYILPGMVLARLEKRRQHKIQLSLPDALDLLVVSVEAGLGLDQAIQRVGEELAFAHRDLSDELRLINLELRAGKARAEALHNLAERTGVDDVASLVAMLVQTDKFGTSIAQSLRVHSDTLRTKRRQRAEEAAAKTGVKMVFPLVFCIFPAIFVVTVGPAAIKFIQVMGDLGAR